MRRRLHRWIGLALAVPFFTWTVTGLLFLVKPGWGGAYETLSAERDEPIDLRGVSLPVAVASSALRADLVSTAIGPVWRVRTPSGPLLVRDGRVVSPLSVDDAKALARDAASRSQVPARYGEVEWAQPLRDFVAVRFVGGAMVRVDRDELRIEQSGRDTSRIDWLYRVHYLQWTGIDAFDRALAIAAIVATWALTALGLTLLVRG